MKLLQSVSLALVIIIMGCEDPTNKSLTKTVAITSNIELMIPEGYEVLHLQGHDSSVGRIINSSDSSSLFSWDIGFLAGEYADPDGENTKSANSINSSFNYEIRDSGFIGVENCCGFFTFPDHGPANFICLTDENYDLVFDIMKTFRAK